MSLHMTMYLFFQGLHIETVWVIQGINSESAKIRNTLIQELKNFNHAPNLKVHINAKLIQFPSWCSLFPPAIIREVLKTNGSQG